SALRLRRRPMRRLHGACGRTRDPFLHHPDFSRRRQQSGDTGRPRHAGEAAPAADGLRRRGSPAMRLLHQRLDHDSGRAAGDQEEAERRRDQGGAHGAQVPLRHAYGHRARRQARRRDDGLREAAMTKMEKSGAFSRRSALKTGGAFVLSVGMPVGLDTVLGVNAALAQGAKPPLVPDQLSSYIAVNADGSVMAFFGKTDLAQGVYAGIGQIVAEELDVPYERVTVIMGDTDRTINQGGASGSTGIQNGGKHMRMVAAEARRVLVEMAAEQLKLPADQLTVTDGVVQAKSD